jgi:hypothetical protein
VEETLLASHIPEIMSLQPPASAEQVDRLAIALSLELPDEYRALLMEANGVSANLVTIYPAEDVPERNATYEVAKYSPGYFVIGTVNCFPVLLRAGKSSPVFGNDWGAMSPEIMSELGSSLATWIAAKCPARNGEPAAD